MDTLRTASDHRLLPLIQQMVRQELQAYRTSLLGVVTEIFPHEAEDDENNYEVNLRLKYEGLELRRVPLAVAAIGVAAPPRVGDLVLVQFINGDLNQPVVSGRFYHDQERPPLHVADDVLFEHRANDKLNHLRFSADGSIYLQRDVTKPEDNSEAKAGIKIDPDGNIEIQAGEKVVITLTNDNKIEIKAEGYPIDVTCDTLTVNGKLHVTGDTAIDTQVEVGSGPKTTITGGQIQGG